MVHYIEAPHLSYQEAVQYLSQCNTDPGRQFQLVLSGVYGDTEALSFGDYSGVSVRRVRRADGALFTEFTDRTAFKEIAEPYWIEKATSIGGKATQILDAINQQR